MPRVPEDWCSSAPYGIGHQVLWAGVRLVCTTDHYAGDAAVHPWDPGAGWSVPRAAALWAPAGPEEARKLREHVARLTAEGDWARLPAIAAEYGGGKAAA